MIKARAIQYCFGQVGIVTHLEVQAENIADRDIGITALQIHPKIGCHRLARNIELLQC